MTPTRIFKPLSHTFSCLRCCKGKPMLGRKARFVLGCKGFICADCAKKEGARSK